MRKNRRRLVILTIVCVLFILFLGSKEKVFNLVKPPTPTLITAKADSFNQITIKTATKTTNLVKKNGVWVVKQQNLEYPADQARIQQIIENVLLLKKDEIVSSNKNRQLGLGIDQQKIELKNNFQKFDLYIGKNASSAQYYVRFNNENDVFLGAGLDNILYPDDFRDLQLHFVNDENQVKAVVINYDGSQLTLRKTNDQWTVNNKAAKTDRIDYFLNDLKTLKGSNIVTNAVISDQPDLTIKINNNGELLAYIKDQDNYYVKVNKTNFTYEVAAAYINALKKTAPDFSE